jgi:hypothetical protein
MRGTIGRCWLVGSLATAMLLAAPQALRADAVLDNSGLENAQRLMADLSVGRAASDLTIFMNYASTAETVAASITTLFIDDVVQRLPRLADPRTHLIEQHRVYAALRSPYYLAQITAAISKSVIKFIAATTPNSIAEFYMAVDQRRLDGGSSCLHRMSLDSWARLHFYAVPRIPGGEVPTPYGIVAELVATLAPQLPAANVQAIVPVSLQNAIRTEFNRFLTYTRSNRIDTELTVYNWAYSRVFQAWMDYALPSITFPPYNGMAVEITDTRVVHITYQRGPIEIFPTPDFRYVIHGAKPGFAGLSARLNDDFARRYGTPLTTRNCMFEVVGPPPSRSAQPSPPVAVAPPRVPPAPHPPQQPPPLPAQPSQQPAPIPPAQPLPYKTCDYQASLTDPDCMPK